MRNKEEASVTVFYRGTDDAVIEASIMTEFSKQGWAVTAMGKIKKYEPFLSDPLVAIKQADEYILSALKKAEENRQLSGQKLRIAADIYSGVYNTDMSWYNLYNLSYELPDIDQKDDWVDVFVRVSRWNNS